MTRLRVDQMIATPRAARVPPMLDFWKEEAAGFERRLVDVLAALDEAGVDPGDKLEEGDAVRALTAARDAALADAVEAKANYKSASSILAGWRHKAMRLERERDEARAALAAEHGGYIGGALS